MKVDDFLKLMKKVQRFKFRLQQEGITGEVQDIILKIYISDLTSRINTDMLGVL